MPLPADFYWTTRSASRPDDRLTVIACHGMWVVAMGERVNYGIWIESLDRHRRGSAGRFSWCTTYLRARARADAGVPGARPDCVREAMLG